MAKYREISSNGWQPVKLEGAILSSGVDGLIGIEELSDYKLEHKNSAKPKSALKRKKQQSNNGASPKKKLKRSKSPNSEKQSFTKSKSTKTSKNNNSNSDHKKPLKNGFNDQKQESISSNVSNDFNKSAWSLLGVPEIILKSLEEQDFSAPTLIQSLTLAPAILGRRDILGAAETGSGKTLAFGIPILTGILEHKQKNPENCQHSIQISSSGSTNHGWFVTKEENSKDIKKSFNLNTPEEENISDTEFDDSDDKIIPHKNTSCVKVIKNVDIEGSNEFRYIPRKPLYALILTPTRELAIQIKNHLYKVAKFTDIKIAVVVGGMAVVKQERILSKGPEIVIATPGRLWELIDQGNVHLNQLDKLKFLAIDETDRMLEKGHFQELHQLLEKINFSENSVKHRQTFVFSATLTLVHDIPDFLIRKKQRKKNNYIYKLTPGQKLQKMIELLRINNPKIVDVTKEKGTAGNLTECRIACTIDHKDYYLYYFLKRHSDRTLIFCNSIGCVKRLATLFGILNCNPLPLHAGMAQKQRLKNLERFQDNPKGLLIATDVAARGLDIPNIEHVIHYQVPRTSESYIHRSGRTARVRKEGITVLMMEPSEMQFYTKLCTTLGRTEDIPKFPIVDKLLIAVKECVNLAREIDKLELICRRDTSRKGWMKKAAEDMDLLLDEDQVEQAMEEEETAIVKRQLKIKRHQLTAVLSKPLFPKGYSGKYLDESIEIRLLSDKETAVEKMRKFNVEKPKVFNNNNENTVRKHANFKKFKKSIK